MLCKWVNHRGHELFHFTPNNQEHPETESQLAGYITHQQLPILPALYMSSLGVAYDVNDSHGPLNVEFMGTNLKNRTNVNVLIYVVNSIPKHI